ncbi:Crp/Fnr family transcriptional regulator [Bacillus salipaludis]|uniref:Crp/Fnr family transcriptional regulator n=1 Tax=Bacillus salipaludis TaxID=2547811 RepID=A0ABW8RGA5_9BACI
MKLLFASNSNWEEFLPYGNRQFYKKGSVLHRQGEVGEGFYYLEKGLVKITTTTASGSDSLLRIALPSQLLGVQAMDQLVHYTTAAANKNSVLYFFPYEMAKELMFQKPAMNELFLQSVIDEMYTLALKINDYRLPAEQKVAMLLLNIYEEFHQHDIPLTQKDVANSTGLTRITVYKIFKEWKEKGYIATIGKSISIINPSILQNYAQGIYK